MPIPITPGKAVTHNEELASIKSEDPLITWSFKVMWQIKSLIYPLTQWLQSPNLAGWLHATWYISTTTVIIGCWIIRGTKSHTIVCHVRSQNQLNTLYSYYNRPLANKLGMLWGASTHKVTQPFKHMVFWNHVTNIKHFIATKISKMVT